MWSSLDPRPDRTSARVEESRLIAQAQRGDARAFAALVGLHTDALLRLCCRYLRRAEAEDVTQETLVRCFVNLERLEPNRPVRPWLFTVARRLCIDQRRKHGAVTDGDSPPELESHSDPERAAEGRERLRHLETALRSLPEGPREAVALFHLDELSYADVAAVLGVPEGTVMTWLHRGRAALRLAVREVPDE